MKWIKVEEKEPDEHELYIAYDKDGCFEIVGGFVILDSQEFEYYMELPPLPEEKK